jgi:hypothetical protein
MRGALDEVTISTLGHREIVTACLAKDKLRRPCAVETHARGYEKAALNYRTGSGSDLAGSPDLTKGRQDVALLGTSKIKTPV